jgi:tetratricopeptide (TPR) repeat protein
MHAGDSIEGTLLDIDDECLIIDARDREIILEANAIAVVERLSSGSARVDSPPGKTVAPVPQRAVHEITEVAAPTREVIFPVVAEQFLADLKQRIRTFSLEIAAPEWVVYDDDLDIETKTRLDRLMVAVKNRYEFALKTRNSDKVLECIGSLRKIAEEYDAPDALQTAGRISWQLGERGPARALFAEAADALNDSPACFDLAVVQYLTDERELAPATLRNCLDEDAPAHDPALGALLAIVLTDGTGKAELAGLVRDAGGWRAGHARLAVLYGGLICVVRAELTGFPLDQWDSPSIAADAFEILARTLHGKPVPARAAVTGRSPLDVARVAPRPSGSSTVPRPSQPASQQRAVPDATEVKNRLVEVMACLNRKDIAAAEHAVAALKAFAPLHSLTWRAERALQSELQKQKEAARQPTVRTYSPAPGVKAIAKAHISAGAGNSPFARAEDAFRRYHLSQAQQLYEQAIAQDDQPIRAVRRLVQLLSTRQKKRDEALAVLQKHRNLFQTEADLWSWRQDRSTVLEHAGRWSEAEEELRHMFKTAPTGDDRIRVSKRLAVALLKIFKYAEAREVLRLELRSNPGEPALQTALDQLNQAMETGVYTKVEATLQQQADGAAELSPLLAFHLDKCEYRGVRAEIVARRDFSEDDIELLDQLLSGGQKKGARRSDYPRERADYSLSAARIWQDLQITDDRFRSRLRYFAAAMGDWCALEEKGADVIRAYYTEAVSVKSQWEDLVDVKLRQLVMSFTQSDARLLEMGTLPGLEKALALVMNEKHLTMKVLVALLALPTQGDVAKRLIRRVWDYQATRELFQQALVEHLEKPMPVADQGSFTEAWLAAAEQDRTKRKIYRQISVLAEAGPVLTALDRHSSELKRIKQEREALASSTDQARIDSCLDVVTGLRQYLEQSAYVERERLYGSVSRAIRDHLREFENAPTVLSLEILNPYLRALEAELRQHFEQYDASAAPDSLKAELVVNRFLPSGGMVTVQLQVSNDSEASPVSNVELVVLPSADYTTAKDLVPVAESIGAGESKTCQISLVASRPAIEQELITLNCEVNFTLRSQDRVTARMEPKSIRLHPDEEWVEIENPYIAGLPVEDPKMFMGRGQLIANLVETVGHTRGSVVVFGQKRAGKSSVLFHLKEALTRPHLAVSFSMLDLSGGVTFSDLLYAIGFEVFRTLSELAEKEGIPGGSPPEPDVEQIRLAPQLKFTDYMTRLQKWLKGVPELSDCHLVLLIDEFSVIHKEIRNGNLPKDFMKGWKAMLERGFFRCVLVGNDLMPRFIGEFANEFQVARQERVSYLVPIYARQLIENPIRLPDGTSRYRGNAVERILELTGCSPYYIQLFCHELVQYMNREDVRAPAIGPADVDTVAKRLIADLDRTEFDNLLTPGDSEVTDISGDLVIEVLCATRREAGPSMYHEDDNRLHPEAGRVIEDLARREVLNRVSGSRYRIQVGLFSEWLQHRWT